MICKVVKWINMDQNSKEWRAVVCTVKNLLVIQNTESFYTSEYTSFSDTALLDVII
jgi:hypothetical protein